MTRLLMADLLCDEALGYRSALFAALDQLHAAQQTIAVKDETIARLRDELLCRMGVPKEVPRADVS